MCERIKMNMGEKLGDEIGEMDKLNKSPND